MNKPDRSNLLPMGSSSSRRSRRFKWRKYVLVGITVWAAYVFFFVQSPNLERLNGEQEKLHDDIQMMQQQNAELGQKIVQLQDPHFIAEMARKKYMMVQDGETLFVEPKQEEKQ